MTEEEEWLVIRKEQALAFGKRVSDGFLVRAGSTAMREGSPTVKRNRGERDNLVSSGVLVLDDNPALFRFAVDHVFNSISAAAGVVIDGNSNGDHWKEDGSLTAVATGLASLQALLSLLTRKEIDAAMGDCEALGLSTFLARGGFVRPQVWVKSLTGGQSYPAKAIVAAALGYLPDGRALSAKEFFNGFGETQAFSRLEELGYDISRKGASSGFGDLSREEIEAAMDAYDAYKATGEHGEIFRSFGDPRDYWVRSTRDRQSRVYPTKPLVGFISKKTVLNGGWGQKSDAAARLHNSGFIIVDQDDRPIPPPERYDHLMSDADRIRLCALNYYIEPARERSLQSVSIVVSDLAAAMALKDRFPNICQTLGGKKFQQLANVPVPTHTEPNPSSSTIFTYKLDAQVEADSLTEATTEPMPAATNLILYGPPGTGKTYHTAWEAVRLCLGEAATELREADKREALMAEYRRLVDAQRIEFVTFHQSMSYEEFVEGLRPSTGEDAIDGALIEGASAGFHLKPCDGVFKRMCERAERDVGELGALNRLDRSRRIIRLGLTGSNWPEKLNLALREQRIEWPHGGDIDWSPPEYDSWEAIKAKRQEKEPDVLGNHPTVYGTWLFRGAEAGEYVALTVGKGKIVALGRLNGEYSFQSGVEGQAARHLRSVEWLWHDAAGLEGMYRKDFTSFHTAYPLLEGYLNWDGLDHAIFGAGVYADISTVPASALAWSEVVIDRTNRAWQDLFGMAQLFLRNRYQTTSTGSGQGTALLFEMNMLFEEYIGRQVRRALAGTGLDVRLQGGRLYCLTAQEDGRRVFQTKPDILIFRGADVVHVIDTKWKRIAAHIEDRKQGVSQSDVYQMMAYAHLYKAPRLTLLYPHHGSLGKGEGIQARFRITDQSTVLETASVDVAIGGKLAQRLKDKILCPSEEASMAFT